MREHTLSTAALYLACGVNPERSTLFIQSQVPAHAQLARLLEAVTPVGLLKRMIQFKEKSVRQGQEVNLALLDYPVLMAADILLYRPDLVPVGDDQKQHLQLARELAERFNRTYETVFKLPEPLVAESGARIMSLVDATCKMSKSCPVDASRINLLDSADQIAAKIRKAKTDAVKGLRFDDPERPEAHNLLTLYQLMAGLTREEAQHECADLGFGQFKPRLTEALVAALSPIRSRYVELMNDRASLLRLLEAGREKACEVAAATLSAASNAMGFLQA